MGVSFGGQTPEQTPEETPKNIEVTPAKKHNAENPHPDKGIYLKVPLDSVKLESTAYIGVASTGQLGITNIKFTFPIDLGDGEVELTYHAGWGNLTIERTAEYQKAHKLLGKKSGVHVEELPDYTVDDTGTTNIQELLGPRKEKAT